jgi:glycosyltransferase involved in cell wall biosynthesis
VVTTTGGCFAEAGGPGSAYVDPHDAAALRETLARLLEDEGARARMREEGLRHVAHFSDEAIAGGLAAAYDVALSRR